METEMMQKITTRRSILAGLVATVGSLVFLRGLRAAGLTPGASEGPYYPTGTMRRADVDNDLVKVMGLVRDAGGEVITLRGQITDASGTPLPDHRIEIWQTDTNGKYLHPGDSRPITHDQGFQGFGHDITDPDGQYRFRTIKPGKYPGRTPHIHVKVFDEQGTEVLTTQFYEDGNSENGRDSLFRRMSSEQARSVTMAYMDMNDGIEAIVNVTV